MGVKGLFPFLKNHVADCITPITIGALKGKRIAIDGNLHLFREYASPWLGFAQKKRYVIWVLRLARVCRQHNISPIVVFDSPETTPAKARERARRSLVRERVRSTLRDTEQRAARLYDLEAKIDQLEGLSREDQLAVQCAMDSAVQARLTNDGTPARLTRNQRSEESPKKDTQSDITQIEAINMTDDPSLDHATLALEVQDAFCPDDPSVSETPQHELSSLARTLINHVNSVRSSRSRGAAAELSLLLRMADSTLQSPVAELKKLQADTAETVERLSRRVVYPQEEDIRRASVHLDRFGIPVQISPDRFEGECTASHFVRCGLADYVATEDSDVLVYGVPQVRGFMSLSQSGSRSKLSLAEMKLVDPKKILSGMQRFECGDSTDGWTEEMFLDFALLCGTDFTEGILGFGIIKAAMVIGIKRSLEDAVPHILSLTNKTGAKKGLAKYVIKENFQNEINIARVIFTTYPVNHDSLNSRLRTQETVNAAFDVFHSTCRNDAQWEKIEQAILHEEMMTVDDIAILNQPNLFQARWKADVTMDSTTFTTPFNDRPSQ